MWKQQRFIIVKGIIRVPCLSGVGVSLGERRKKGDGNGVEGSVCSRTGHTVNWGRGVTQRIWVR